MESSIYGTLDTGVVDVDYDPYDDWSYSGVKRVEELPDLVNNVVFRVSGNALDLGLLSDEFEDTELSKMRNFFERGLREEKEEFIPVDTSLLNVVEIDPVDVAQFNADLEAASQEDFDFFKNFLRDFLTHDRATASLEAFVRDGLELGPFSVDPTLGLHVKNILYMSYINRVLAKSKLPKSVASNYLELLSASMFDDIKNKTKSKDFQSMIKRYREELDNPVGADKNSIGSIKRGRDYGSRQKGQ